VKCSGAVVCDVAGEDLGALQCACSGVGDVAGEILDGVESASL
jgi:hypothetical protein